jgi:hypothetical protein
MAEKMVLFVQSWHICVQHHVRVHTQYSIYYKFGLSEFFIVEEVLGSCVA